VSTTPHRFVDHVSEVELALEAESQPALFREATAAFRELVDTRRSTGEALRFDVSLGPARPEVLLVDWLDELVFLAEVEGFIPERVVRLELGEGRLDARLEGRRGRPRHIVKGATFHDLELARLEEEWHARVVLDV